MNFKLTVFALIVLAAFAITVIADDRDYVWVRECDQRCDYSNRMNPFVQGCDDCCRRAGVGFSKGKCKGFGWKNCMCKTSTGQRLLNSIFSG